MKGLVGKETNQGERKKTPPDGKPKKNQLTPAPVNLNRFFGGKKKNPKGRGP